MNKFILSIAILVLFAGALAGQTGTSPKATSPTSAIPAVTDNSTTACTSSVLSAAFPAANYSGGLIQVVNSAGTTIVECRSNGTNWVSVTSTSGGTVTSVTLSGTANQITATGTCTGTTTITCTISIPAAFVLPGTIDGLTITTTTGTFTLTNGKTFAVGNTLTITGTDASTVNFPNPTSITANDCVEWTKSGSTIGLADAGSGCGGSITFQSGGTGGTATTMNVTPGTGMLMPLVVSGGVATYSPVPDTSVMATNAAVANGTNQSVLLSDTATSGTWLGTISALSAYTNPQFFGVQFSGNSCIGSDTINLSGIGPAPVYKLVSGVATAVAANDCKQNQSYVISYSATGGPSGVPGWLLLGSGGGSGTGTVTSIATTSPITGGTITTTGTIACATCVVASSPGVGIAHFAGSTQTVTSSTIATADVAANAITSAKLAVVNTRRVCDIPVGDESSSSVIANAQLGPQKRLCYVPAASTVVEMDVSADGGTPNVIVAVNHAGTDSNIVSSALATAASGGIACSNTGGTTGIDGATTCSATLQNTSVAAGDYLELVSGTAGGTAKLMTIHVVYVIQ